MPVDPSCPACQGTGWRETERDGLTAVERCPCGGALPLATRLAEAGVPERFREASFDNFRCRLPGDPNDYDVLTTAAGAVRSFANEYPVGTSRGVLLQGPPGVGKTHLAVSALRRLSERGFQTVFFDYQALLQRIRDSYNKASGAVDRDAYRRALDAEVLLLDDLGAHRATDWVFDTVTAIINHRYNEDKPMIVTTNLPVVDRGGVVRQREPGGEFGLNDALGDRIGERAVSRLFEMCREVRIRINQDYRLRKHAAGSGW